MRTKNTIIFSLISTFFLIFLISIWKILATLQGRIETLISRNKKNRQLMMVSEFNGKKAITNYRTIKVLMC